MHVGGVRRLQVAAVVVVAVDAQDRQREATERIKHVRREIAERHDEVRRVGSDQRWERQPRLLVGEDQQAHLRRTARARERPSAGIRGGAASAVPAGQRGAQCPLQLGTDVLERLAAALRAAKDHGALDASEDRRGQTPRAGP